MAGNKNSGDRNARYTGPTCGAKARSTGQPCRAPAMQNGRCRVHGGATPKGFANASTTHGRHSKYLLKGVLGPMFEEARNDPEKLSLEREVSLVDAMLGQALERISTPESEGAWLGLGRAFEGFKEAQAQRKVPLMHKFLADMTTLIESGSSASAARKEVSDLIELRRKLVESEERRVITSGKAIPVDQVMNMIAVIGRICLDEVADPTARRKISERILSLVHGRNLPVAALPAHVVDAAASAR